MKRVCVYVCMCVCFLSTCRLGAALLDKAAPDIQGQHVEHRPGVQQLLALHGHLLPGLVGKQRPLQGLNRGHQPDDAATGEPIALHETPQPLTLITGRQGPVRNDPLRLV